MVEEPKEGKVYWCILPHDEALSYMEFGKYDPKYPWKGVYVIPGKLAPRLYSHKTFFERPLAEIGNYYYSTVKPENLYNNLEEALVAYADRLLDYLNTLQNDYTKTAEKLRQANQDLMRVYFEKRRKLKKSGI